MAWRASLKLDYRLQQGRSVVHFEHEGPLRVLQSLYPEDDAICHNVLVHPPGGIVGGDTLAVQVRVQRDAHALITTPGATRFYRSAGEPASQLTEVQLQHNARMEWLPLESIAYSECRALNRVRFSLQPGAELIGWDISALGLPEAEQPFLSGHYTQEIEVPGIWREYGRMNACDSLLLNSPLGLGGRRCLGTLFFLTGQPMTRERRDQALDAARNLLPLPAEMLAGATSPHPQVIVVRTVADLVEPVMTLLKALRGAWREQLWGLPPTLPRVWAT